MLYINLELGTKIFQGLFKLYINIESLLLHISNNSLQYTSRTETIPYNNNSILNNKERSVKIQMLRKNIMLY